MTIRARTPRLFVETGLDGDAVHLAEAHAHYLSRVLRLKRGDAAIVFNGRGQEREARVVSLTRRAAELHLGEFLAPLPEPHLDLVLLQAVIKADAMDFVIQKATELGVRTIYPVQTQFSVIKLGAERANRRLEHWIRKAVSACEQSGRHSPPRIGPSTALADALERLPAGHLRLALQPGADATPEAARQHAAGVCLLVGPEGGFSSEDLEIIAAAGFHTLSLGPRILRAETAALAGCVLAQARWGDMREQKGGRPPFSLLARHQRGG